MCIARLKEILKEVTVITHSVCECTLTTFLYTDYSLNFYLFIAYVCGRAHGPHLVLSGYRSS